MAKIQWHDVGGGAQQSKDSLVRFYIQVERRYLGRKAGRPVSSTTAKLFDRLLNTETTYLTVRAAKAAAEALV